MPEPLRVRGEGVRLPAVGQRVARARAVTMRVRLRVRVRLRLRPCLRRRLARMAPRGLERVDHVAPQRVRARPAKVQQLAPRPDHEKEREYFSGGYFS